MMKVIEHECCRAAYENLYSFQSVKLIFVNNLMRPAIQVRQFSCRQIRNICVEHSIQLKLLIVLLMPRWRTNKNSTLHLNKKPN